MLFTFNEKDTTTTRALKTKLLFQSFAKSSDKKFALGSPCCNYLGLWITICTNKVMFATAAKHSLEHRKN